MVMIYAFGSVVFQFTTFLVDIDASLEHFNNFLVLISCISETIMFTEEFCLLDTILLIARIESHIFEFRAK